MTNGIWLEISDVRLDGNDVEVWFDADQGDRDRERTWRKYVIAAGDSRTGSEIFREVTSGIDKQRHVLGFLSGEQRPIVPPTDNQTGISLVCTQIRIQQRKPTTR